MNKEQANKLPNEEILRLWFQGEIQDGCLTAETLPQVAPNQHVDVYKVAIGSENLFVKIYLDRPEVAEHEIHNYLYYRNLPFVPSLRYTMSAQESNRRLLAYEFIPGNDLHRQLTFARQAKGFLDNSIWIQSIDQIIQMNRAIKNFDDVLPDEIPWPLKSPMRKGFMDNQTEQLFQEAYSGFFEANKEIIRLFPGYYFDRNPRNIMRDSEGIHQVDFGVIEKSSPIFDFVKLLRNGTDIDLGMSSLDFYSIASQSPLRQQISAVDLSQESKILQYCYLQLIEAQMTSSSFEEFHRVFMFASVHNHIFYLSKYLKMLREGKGVGNILAIRVSYHKSMMEKTLEELTDFDKNVLFLRPWIVRMIDQSKK